MENDRRRPAGSPPEGGGTGASPTRPRRRWLGGLIAVASVAALAGLGWHLTHRESPAGSAGRAPTGTRAGSPPGGPPGAGRRGGPPPTTVGVAAATAADIPLVLDALGTVTPSATITVRPQVSGVLTRVLFQEGQNVVPGQPLAQIDTRPLDLAAMQARGQLLRDEAQLENARLTLQRYRTLLDEDSIARQDVDTQAALVKQLEGVVMTDQAAVGTAALNLSYATVKAPVAGRIGLRNVDIGNLVNTGDAAGVATITQLAPIDVEFSIPQDRVPDVQSRLAAGALLPVTVYDRTRTRALDTGRFLSLDNQSDVQTGTVRAKARFANAGHTLFPAQFVNVRLLLDTLRHATVVPVTAIRHGPDGDFVWVLNEDRTVSQRAVTTGPGTADRTSVQGGLALGERVITEGGDRLKDGARVMLPGDVPAGGARGASGATGPGGWGASAGGRAGSGAWGGRHHGGAGAPASSGASAPGR